MIYYLRFAGQQGFFQDMKTQQTQDIEPMLVCLIMLVRHCRWCANIEPALVQYLMFSGEVIHVYLSLTSRV